MTEENFAQFFADAAAENIWTPDVPVLEMQDSWYVFVYGDKRGKSSSFFTNQDSDAEFIGLGWTKSNVYSILRLESGKLDLYLADITGTDRILGEVWKVPTDQLLELDSMENNDYITRRLSIPVIVNGRVELSAWIYVANHNYLIKGNMFVSKYTGKTYYGDDSFLEIT